MFSKQDLIKELTESTSTFATKAEAERAIAGVLDGIKSLVSQDEAEGVNLVGFGSFRKVTRAARQGRNPATGETIQIKESKSVSFKVSKPFKESLK
jgi:DNA-binding protein HU-beta